MIPAADQRFDRKTLSQNQPIEILNDANRRCSYAIKSRLSIIIVLAVFVAARLSQFHAPTSVCDEGLELIAPELILRGFLPSKDFIAPYGPAGFWFLAGVFKVFGVSLFAERLVTIIYQSLCVIGVFALVRGRGLFVATSSALTTVVIFQALQGYAWPGYATYACQIWAVYLLSRTSYSRVFFAGIVGGIGLLFRPEALPALVLASIPFLPSMSWKNRRHFATGIGIALTFYGWYCLAAGPDNVLRVFLESVSALRAASLPAFQLKYSALVPCQVVVILSAFLMLAAALANLFWKNKGTQIPATKLPGLQLLSLSSLTIFFCLPHAFVRADEFHCFANGFLPISLMPAALMDLGQALARQNHLGRTVTRFFAALVPIAMLVLTRTYNQPAKNLRQWLTQRQTTAAYRIEHDGRYCFVSSAEQQLLYQRLFATVDSLTRPGQKLFVGPQELRRTFLTETSLYYLFPKLIPNSFYIVMAGPVSMRPGSKMIDDIDSSDILILSDQFDSYTEPNESGALGSSWLNDEVANKFLLEKRIGRYAIYLPKPIKPAKPK